MSCHLILGQVQSQRRGGRVVPWSSVRTWWPGFESRLSDLFYHSSHLHYICWWMAWLVILYYYYYHMETLNNVSGSISFTYHLIPRGRKTIWILHVAFANIGNRTRATYTASKCAMHYSIAFRHNWETYVSGSKGLNLSIKEEVLWFWYNCALGCSRC